MFLNTIFNPNLSLRTAFKMEDKQVRSAGSFVLGAKGRLIPLKGPKARFKITQFDPGKSYTFKTKLPFGGLYVKRYWEQKEGKTFFTHEVWFDGWSARFFAK